MAAPGTFLTDAPGSGSRGGGGSGSRSASFRGGGRSQGPGRGGARSAPNPLLDPSQTLSGKPLYNAAVGIADAQTKGPLAELAAQKAREITQGQAAQGQTFGYYMQLAKDARASLDQTQQIGQGLNSQLQSMGQNTQQQLSQFGQNAQQNGLGGLSAMGLDGGAQAALKAASAQQQATGALNSGAARMFGAVQGANYASNAASNLGTFALRGQERIGDIGKATQLAAQPLASKQAALIASKGALTATALGQLRTQERNYQIAKQGLGIKSNAITASNQRNQATIQGANSRNAATNRTSRADNAATILGANQRNQATINAANSRNAANNATRQAIANARTGAGSTKPLTPQQNNKNLGDLSKIINAIQTWQQTGIKNGKGQVIEPHPTNAQMRQVLGANYGQSFLIQAAFELLGWGHITPATARLMHAAGIRGGSYQNAPIKVADAPVAAAPLSQAVGSFSF